MKITRTASGKKTIKIAKDEWEKIGQQAGWMSKNWEVIDSKFNQQNYPDLVGKVFINPPSYCQVKEVDKEADYEDIRDMKTRESKSSRNIKRSAREYADFEIIDPSEVKSIIDSFGSQRFWIGYRKKNGEYRRMEAQRRVDKMSGDPDYVPDASRQQVMENSGLITVYDLGVARQVANENRGADEITKKKAMRKAYRSIYPEKVEMIHGGGKEYLVSTAENPELVEKINQKQNIG